MADDPRVLRPRPLRAFNSAFAGPTAVDLPPSPSSSSHHPQFFTEASTTTAASPVSPSLPPSPPITSSSQDNSDLYERTLESPGVNPATDVDSSNGSSNGSKSSSAAPSRSQSVLNLTSSALAGIFQPSSPSSPSASPRYDSSALRDSRLKTTTRSSRARAQSLLYRNGENIDENIDEKRSRDSQIDDGGGDGNATTNTTTVADSCSSNSSSSSKSFNDGLVENRGLDSTKKEVNSFWRRKAHQNVTRVDTVRALLRLGLLFVLGIAYGLMVSRLHDGGMVAPVQVQGVDRSGWLYSCLWGCAGILLGTTMPWVDVLWSRKKTIMIHKRSTDNLWEKWYAVVRSVGAFVGVAFAIRKLPWQSTLQLSVTLALANPALWYLLDRSSPGIFLSTLISLVGTIAILHLNPEMLSLVLNESSKDRWITMTNPRYSASDRAQYQLQNQEQGKSNRDAGYSHYDASFLLYEQIGVVTWIASVLFCSCVCLGNIGRRLVMES